MSDQVQKVVVVIGARGWIGSQCMRLLKDIKDVQVHEYKGRATDALNLQNFLVENRATHLLSTIGRTHGVANGKEYPSIDYLELSGKLVENLTDNLLGPVTMMKICDELNIHFTYMGTGCIYEYDEKHSEEDSGIPFGDSELPNFFGSQYSVVKGITDRIACLFASTAKNVLNLRIRMPISTTPHPRDFVTKIVGYNYIHSRSNSMTVLDDLLPAAMNLLLKDHVGSVNLVNEGPMSHNEILGLYKKYVKPDHEWKEIPLKHHDAMLMSKRSNNHLQQSAALRPYKIPTLKESIERILSNQRYVQ